MSKEAKNELYGELKGDNSTRVLIVVVCVLILLIAGLCVYFFVFAGNTDTPEVSAEVSSEASKSESVPDISSEESSSSAAEESTTSSESQEISHASESSQASSEPLFGWKINSLGYTYLYYGIGLEEFTGSATIRSNYTTAVNSLYSLCVDKNFYHILVPTRCEFVDIPREIRQQTNFYYKSQNQYINDIFDNSCEGIKTISMFDIFKEKYENEEPIYFNTDPNYTQYAAYSIYEQYCNAAGIIPISLETYPGEVLNSRFLGRFFTATNSESLMNNADELYYYDIDSYVSSKLTIYKSNGSTANWNGVIFTDVPSYSFYTYLKEEAGRIDITTQLGTKKKCLVIGDSSASPFVTFLVPHYDLITFLNDEIYNESFLESILNGGYNDIIVINKTTTSNKTAYKNINAICGTATGN